MNSLRNAHDGPKDPRGRPRGKPQRPAGHPQPNQPGHAPIVVIEDPLCTYTTFEYRMSGTLGSRITGRRDHRTKAKPVDRAT
jgi:hypothetical protein